MTDAAASSFARLHDGKHPVSKSVEVQLLGEQLQVDGEHFALSAVQASPRTGSADRFISLPNGSELQVPDAPWLDRLPVPEQGALVLAWLEARAWVAAGSLLGILGFAAWFWFSGLPLLAAFGARHVPFFYEQRLGRQALANLDGNGYFAASDVDAEDQETLRQSFAALVATLPRGEQAYQLELRRAQLGPNAIALPGNIIVVTDDLLGLCPGDEVLAVLAHELAHARERHVMRSYFADVGLSALTSTLWGGTATTGVAIDATSLQLLELGYSRELEQAADDGAFEILRRAGLRPALLGDALERMTHPDAHTDDAADEDGEAIAEEPGAAGAGSAGSESEADAAAEAEGEGGESGEPEEPGQDPSPAPFNWVERRPDEDESADAGDDAEPAESTPAPTPVRTTEDTRLDDTREENDNPWRGWPQPESWSFLSTHPVTQERIARARAQK